MTTCSRVQSVYKSVRNNKVLFVNYIHLTLFPAGLSNKKTSTLVQNELSLPVFK